MAKIICEECGSSYPYEVAKTMESCPVCGEPLFGESGGDMGHQEELSFGDDVELGAFDSFDEDKIGFWWYEIREPKTLDERDSGDVTEVCTKCREIAGGGPYPIARTGNYILMNPRYHPKCYHCGNETKNHIFSKCPESWILARQKKDMEMKMAMQNNIPRCPTCRSTNIRKISATSKVASVAVWGVLSRKVHKQWHCNACGSEW